MIVTRKSSDRGHSENGWLDSFHTFSFAEYFDNEFMGFGHLRVINEDTIQPGSGFGRHSHKNMEIITYVVEGLLEHKDSLGTGSIIRPGEIQKMSAGTGIEHSEFNHSNQELLHLLQIWIIPEKQHIKPGYEQKPILRVSNKLILIGSPEGRDNAVTIHQDINLYVAYMTPENQINYSFKPERKAWLQLIKGQLTVNDQALSAGDGAIIEGEDQIRIKCQENAEFLLFDLNE